MEKKKKKEYAAPTTDVVEVKTQRFLCGSPQFPDYTPGGDPFFG